MASIHDPRFALDPTPPWPFGSSAFKVRGRVYMHDLETYERLLPAGVDAAVAQAGVPGLSLFLLQRFDPGIWYDMLPSAYLASAVARARGVSYGQQLRENGRSQAARLHEGFRGLLLSALSSDTVALWMPRASGYYYNFGKVHTEVTAPGRVRGVRTGVPHALLYAMSVPAMEFTEEALRHAGARRPRAHSFEPEIDGYEGGLVTYSIPFEIQWDG